EFMQKIGFESARVQDYFELYLTVIDALPDYLEKTAGQNLSVVEKAEALRSSLQQSEANLDRPDPWNVTHEKASYRLLTEIEECLKKGDADSQKRLADIVAFADEFYENSSRERKIAVASLKRDLLFSDDKLQWKLADVYRPGEGAMYIF